jgi:hypothetical protein
MNALTKHGNTTRIGVQRDNRNPLQPTDVRKNVEKAQAFDGRRDIHKLSEFYAGMLCYLDGGPASITGRGQPFAKVVRHGENWHRFGPVEFSWFTIDRVMKNHDGTFYSK